MSQTLTHVGKFSFNATVYYNVVFIDDGKTKYVASTYCRILNAVEGGSLPAI
jgi:hypothetical protein